MQSAELWIARKRPDDPTLVQQNLVGAFQIVEDTVERLILQLPWEALPEFLLRRIGFCLLNLSFNHEDSVQPGFVENRGRCQGAS